MAADRFPSQSLDALRLKLMQEVLPVGLAVADRARKGGAKDVIAAFQGDEDPIEQLRQEGSEAASQVRERLDRLSPGLGNPVMKVEVRDGLSPRRRISLKVQGRRDMPLTRVGEPMPLADLELSGAQLARFLGVPLEGV